MTSPGALRQSRDEVPSVSSQRPCIGPYTWFATESFSDGMLDLVEMGNLSPTSVRWLVRRGSRPPSGDTADVAHTGARRVVSKRWPLTASSRGITLQMAPPSPPQSDLSHAFCLRSAVEVRLRRAPGTDRVALEQLGLLLCALGAGVSVICGLVGPPNETRG